MNRFIAVAVALVGVAAWAQASTEVSQFELKVGGQSHDVVEGKPLTITTPKGERVELIFSRKAEQIWSGDGLQFRYPREMQLSREESDGVVSLTLESTNSVLALVQLFPEGVPAALVKRELEASIVQEFAARGGRVKKKAGTEVSRKLGKQEMRGLRFEIDMAGESFQVDIFSVVHKRQVLGVILQSFQQDHAVAQRWFETILGSMQ
jgi:hypothetical protein